MLGVKVDAEVDLATELIVGVGGYWAWVDQDNFPIFFFSGKMSILELTKHASKSINIIPRMSQLPKHSQARMLKTALEHLSKYSETPGTGEKPPRHSI